MPLNPIVKALTFPSHSLQYKCAKSFNTATRFIEAAFYSKQLLKLSKAIEAQ
jgi:hypothetical protein